MSEMQRAKRNSAVRTMISRRRDFSEIVMRHRPGKGEGRRNARSLKNSSPICALPKMRYPCPPPHETAIETHLAAKNRINTPLIRKRNNLSSYEFLRA